jgi:hypothetical protein
VFNDSDVKVKSRLQTDSIVKSERKYKNAIDCMIKVFKTEGIRSFYRGFGYKFIEFVSDVN